MEMIKTALEGYWYHCSFLAWQWESRKNLSGHTDRDDPFSVPKPKEYTIGWKGIQFLSKKKLGKFPQHLQTNTHGLHICGMSKSSWPGQRAHQSLPHRPLPTPGALTFSPASAWELPWALWVWREETHTFLQTKCKSYSCHWKYMLGLEFAFTHPHIGCQFSYNWNQRGKTLKI